MKKIALILTGILLVLLAVAFLYPGDTAQPVIPTGSSETTVPSETAAPTTSGGEVQRPTSPSETTPPTTPPTTPATQPSTSKLIVIDPGHQREANHEKEPLGPGSDERKDKVSSGTHGVATGLREYELNLQVSQKLQAVLEDRGYQVVMIRTTHDVDISNAERAQIANELNADAFIRIHANGSDNGSVRGSMTLCQTPKNPYNGDIYEECRLLAECVLDEMVAQTGFARKKVWETDTMTGINWCRVPVTIVEMGYMSNAEEDLLMASDEVQDKLVQGIANGIDKYFRNLDAK